MISVTIYSSNFWKHLQNVSFLTLYGLLFSTNPTVSIYILHTIRSLVSDLRFVCFGTDIAPLQIIKSNDFNTFGNDIRIKTYPCLRTFLKIVFANIIMALNIVFINTISISSTTFFS